MCIGIPMQVVERRSRFALCEGAGEAREIDMALVGEQTGGTWVLVFLDAAREVISAEDAARITDALTALALIAEGEANVDHLFADLIGREPELPEHLRPAGGAHSKGATPHPVPLPQGEGTPEWSPARAAPSLLPGGEGQDEGRYAPDLSAPAAQITP
jgi:hydrogenase expression/formation protein HypC